MWRFSESESSRFTLEESAGVRVMKVPSRLSGFCRNGMHDSCDGTAYFKRGPFTIFEVRCRCPCHDSVKLDAWAGSVE